ncbi:MAG: DUF6596 domain-containing protein [Hyphomicrobiaceae bacterium]|nr:DUF6596 domain-containing protein [Hyphomicrobiaceae bacterium]
MSDVRPGDPDGRSTAPDDAARRAAETAARQSYGRLIALLTARTRDIAASEDALSEALASALATWPVRGVPANPDAWLLTAARNRLSDQHRRAAVAAAAEPEVARRMADLTAPDSDFPDERLKLMFLCAHPAIDRSIRTPLMLQTVLGLDAERIAAAFLVAPATMGQRLVRAKSKIKVAGLRIAVPDLDDLPARLSDVLDAIYAAYGTGWEAIGAHDSAGAGFASEAIYLGRLVCELLPASAEAKGLLSLMLHCEARRPARRDQAGRFVPLSRQDPRAWSRDLIIEAEGLLSIAARHGTFGRYQCEAAIQSLHVARAMSGPDAAPRFTEPLIGLYRLLVTHHPATGAHVGLAAALLEAGDADAAAAALDALTCAERDGYQPYWVTLAHVLAAQSRTGAARAAMQRALELTRDPAVRAHLEATLMPPLAP